jgi:hypothetical protein
MESNNNLDPFNYIQRTYITNFGSNGIYDVEPCHKAVFWDLALNSDILCSSTPG